MYIKEKKFVSILAFIIILIIVIFFLFSTYKKIKFGNNESNKSAEDIKKYIMNIESYTATIEVTVNSNKNTNKYLLKQEYSRNNIIKQTVIEPENIAGVEFEYKDGSLIINNARFNLSKIYSNYPYVSDNILWLSSFADCYKDNEEEAEVLEENNEVIIIINSKNNKYFVTRKLHLEKGTGKPLKMEIIDDNKNTIVYILYNEIAIN